MKRICLTALLLAGVCLGAFSALAQEPMRLRFISARAGSWTSYSAGMVDMLVPKLPKGTSFEVEGASGSIATVKRLQAGTADIGFSFAHTSAAACNGTGIFTEKQDKL